MGGPARLKEVGVSVDFGIFQLDTTWVEDPRQRNAAWALYVEYVTRVAVQALDLDQGLLREALDSLHALVGITREVLRREGPSVGASPRDVGGIAITVLNSVVRPFLAKWHPQLLDWEIRRDAAKVSVREHERAWPDELRCRAALAKLQAGMVAYARLLAEAAGAKP
jgi:hypothetical protein